MCFHRCMRANMIYKTKFNEFIKRTFTKASLTLQHKFSLNKKLLINVKNGVSFFFF